jgi:23S rRNA pseudouridine2605 synthase
VRSPRRGPGKDGGRGERRPSQRRTGSVPDGAAPLRLQAFLARAGVASRRAAEGLITEGRVAVNGAVVTELGTKVHPERDEVTVDGERVAIAAPAWIALHKPRGYVTTRSDPSGRRTVYDLLPSELHSLFHVGRLDRQSEGLLLLTNEGPVANRLLHPRYGIDKEYVATVEGEITWTTLDRLVEGVEVDGERMRAESAEVLHGGEAGHSRLRLVLREGRYREVRRMLESLGHPVTKLTRRRFGPIRLGRLTRGKWRYLEPEEIDSLRRRGGSEPV